MCGRCACARKRGAVVAACAYRPAKSTSAKVTQPSFVGPGDYWPSYNIGPQTYMPVLLSGRHKHVQQLSPSPDAGPEPEGRGGGRGGGRGEGRGEGERPERALQCMKWGLVPHWHRGDPLKFGTMLNNCRLDSIELGSEKPSFRGALHKGQRCVIVADGFYEWQTTKPGSKQPFFIYFANNSHTEETQEVMSQQEVDVKSTHDPPPTEGRMLTMAGLFDAWKPPADVEGEVLYTFTVITVDAHPHFAHIHDRMPAILDSQEAIGQWLDFEAVPTQKALKLLQPRDCLQWYPVSTTVNSIRHKDPECMTKIDPQLVVNSKQKTLKSWFGPKKTSAASQSQTSSDSKPPEKKPKMETTVKLE